MPTCRLEKIGHKPEWKKYLKEDTQPKPNHKKEEKNKMNPVCGLDITKEEAVATILADNFKKTRKFGVHIDELFELKKWLKENNCTKTAMKSTGVYWVPIYASLEESEIEVVLANPRQVKAIPGRKSDVRDSE